MDIWIVISATCSPIGFTDVKVLGAFTDIEDANKLKKDQCINISDNYTISVIKSKLQYPKKKYICDFMDNLPDNIKYGYDVA